MSVNRIGRNAEKYAADVLSRRGYYVVMIPSTALGQPFDLIAIKNDVPYCLDVKHIKGDTFYFSRVEPNQKTSFEMALSCGVRNVGFLFVFDENDPNFYFLKYEDQKHMEKLGLKRVKISDMVVFR